MPTIQKRQSKSPAKERLQKPTQFSSDFIINLTLQSFFLEEMNKITIQTTARQEKRWAFFLHLESVLEKIERIPTTALRRRVSYRAFAGKVHNRTF